MILHESVTHGSAIKGFERFKTYCLYNAWLGHEIEYNYTKFVYKGGKVKGIIICTKHGPFWQTPDNHKRGHGCRECGNEARVKAQTQTTEQFRALAKEVHGDKYDYSRADEKDEEDRRCIICPEHGEFEQKASDHTLGKGCRKCGKYGFQPQLPAQLYLYNIEDRWLGFGITGVPKNRHATHRYTLRNVEHELIHTFEFEEGVNALEIETLLKQKFVTVDTGYDGFRTEAMSISYLDSVLNIIEEHEEL